MNDRKQKQLDIAERLQDMLLQDYERVFQSGDATAADRANLTKMLMANGWSLDPSKLPRGIASMLGQAELPDDDDDDIDAYRALRLVSNG